MKSVINWIDVQDRCPNSTRKVFILCDESIYFSNYSAVHHEWVNSRLLFGDFDSDKMNTPSHWADINNLLDFLEK